MVLRVDITVVCLDIERMMQDSFSYGLRQDGYRERVSVLVLGQDPDVQAIRGGSLSVEGVLRLRTRELRSKSPH